MCGILGKVTFDPKSLDKEVLRQMGGVLTHRGPDQEDIYLSVEEDPAVGPPFCGLGHRRLSIIDLSTSAREPMPNEDETIWLVCNGEVYNFPELRADLIRRGHRFRSKTDVEVILHLYEEMGDACVEQLRGMFAFGLWDQRKKRLFLARDRLGQKPLCYAEANGEITFASEVKALLQDPSLDRRVDPAAIWDYLSYQYVPAPRTGFEGIWELLPGYKLVWEAGSTRTEPYWETRYTPKWQLNEEEACQQLRELLREAVRIRMISDVPLGVLLSGGIDSSIVVALMTEFAGQPVETFSIGFRDPALDESKNARLVADRYETNHHELIIDTHMIDVLPRLAWFYDRPFADSSAVPTYCVSQLAREHVTVALTGDGGDEAFGGYERYAAARFLNGWYQLSPRWLSRTISAWANRGSGGPPLLRKIRRLGATLSLDDPWACYEVWMSHFEGRVKEALCTPEWMDKAYNGGESFLRRQLGDTLDGDFLDRLLSLDTRTYLPNDLLVKVDVASMAHSLEARSPFLDHKVVEFAARLRSDWKMRWGTGKYILKKAFKNLLPPSILERPKKGFGVPLASWFRGELREMACDLLTDTTFSSRGYFHVDFVRRMLDEHIAGTHDWHYQLWNLLILELWHRGYVDRKPSCIPS